ncbi:alpha/beta hydrolase [bacterium]|nr:MAG: alpha/beta hydrolase [bacterium]
MSEDLRRPPALAWTFRLALFSLLFLLCVRFLNAASLFPRMPQNTGEFSFRAGKLRDVREIRFEATDGTGLYGWLCGAQRARHRILFCSGNGGNAALNGERMAQVAAALDAQVLVFDYRGYYLSEGHPSEEGLYQDVRGAWLYAHSELGWPAGQSVIWGHSLGAAVALALAADLHDSEERRATLFGAQAPGARALILESPFSSVADMARHRMGFLGLAHWLVYARLDNLSRAKGAALPALVLHGTADEIIPAEMGRRVQAALPQSPPGIWLEGGKHNTLWSSHRQEMTQAIKQFLGAN